MQKRRQILLKLLNKQRVFIAPENYFFRLKVFIGLLATICIFIVGAILYNDIRSFVSIGVSSLIILSSVAIIYYSLKKLKSAVIQGDTLIVQSIDGNSKVTSLRSIRKVKTRSAFGVSMTKINYSLDGQTNNVVFINMAHTMPLKPDVILNNAIEKSKKRKVNHKPGPVTVN